MFRKMSICGLSLALFLFLFLFLLLLSCQSQPRTATPAQDPGKTNQDPQKAPVVQDKLSINKTNRQLCYQLYKDGQEVAFIFDAKLHDIDNVDRVFLEGSFNGWLKGTDESWLLKPASDGRTWTLSRPAADLAVPGNSGHPEFKFFILQKDSDSPLEPAAISTIPGYQMSTNNLILFPGVDPQEIVKNFSVATTIKQLSDFDLSDPAQAAMISNFRRVPGTTNLYRGYHPYKLSRPQFDTERARSQMVQELFEKTGIKSAICLSGDEKASAAAGESISPYIQGVLDSGRYLNLNTSYNLVYFQSTSPGFSELLARVVAHIKFNPGPYYVHCRLGTDRTGVISGTLAALCGASWEEIAADYQKSNDMGIKEFRDYRLLRHSFRQILGKNPEEVEDLQAGLSAAFIAAGSLSREDIELLKAQLSK